MKVQNAVVGMEVQVKRDGCGQASLPMAKVHKVGVCNATNG